MNCGSAVGIATGYGLDDISIRVGVPVVSKMYFIIIIIIIISLTENRFLHDSNGTRVRHANTIYHSTQDSMNNNGYITLNE
jgi:branched-subunit amino acid permease